jgi:energy-converting hydrogenase A subunit M
MAINPLQLPAYAAPRDLDFSSLAQLPQIYKQAQADAIRRQTLADLGQGGQIDPMRLIRSGDADLAKIGIDFMNRQQDQQQARDKPILEKVKLATGNEVLVYPDGRTRTLTGR